MFVLHRSCCDALYIRICLLIHTLQIFLTFLIQASNTMPQTHSRWLKFFKCKSDPSEQSQGSLQASQGLLKGTHQSCKGYAQSSELLLIVDGSMWQHLPKFLLWLAMEATQIVLCCYQYYHCKLCSLAFSTQSPAVQLQYYHCQLVISNQSPAKPGMHVQCSAVHCSACARLDK